MCKGLNARSCQDRSKKRTVPLFVGFGQRGKQMEHGVFWEELGGHIVDGETCPEKGRAETRGDQLAQRTCVCMWWGPHLLCSSAVSSL